jgi:hypothetical protein
MGGIWTGEGMKKDGRDPKSLLNNCVVMEYVEVLYAAKDS